MSNPIKICLDAGHYGKYNQSPAISSYYESEMNWKLHNYLKAELQAYGFEVIQTRDKQSDDRGLESRGKASKGCNLFLSIHSNAVGSRVDEDVDHPVVFVPLDKSGDKLGIMLGACIAQTMGTQQKADVRYRQGENGDYYGVIRGATSVGVTGLILEHSFHTNTRSTLWLLDDANLKKMAKAEAEVIAKYYSVEKSEPTVYRVQVGAYSVKANAEKMLAKVKAAGFADAYIASK